MSEESSRFHPSSPGTSYEKHGRRSRRSKMQSSQKQESQPTPVILGARPAQSSSISSNQVRILNDSRESSTSSQQSQPFHQSQSFEGTLLNEKLEFCLDDLVMQASDQESVFTVVGVIGMEGVGKSTILKALNEHFSTDNLVDSTEEELNRYTIRGVHFSFSAKNKLVLLDVQALFSSSILFEIIQKEEKFKTFFDSISYENLHDVQSIQLAVLVFSICHVVLVVQEGMNDVTFWKFMRTVEMLKTKIPDISLQLTTQDALQTEFFAETVFVFNKTQPRLFSEDAIMLLRKTLDGFFPPSMKTYNNFQPSKDTQQESPKQKHVNFFLLPFEEETVNHEMKCYTQGTFSSLMQDLRFHILNMEKREYAKSINLKDWLKNASKIWDIVRKSAMIHDYNKLTQKNAYLQAKLVQNI